MEDGKEEDNGEPSEESYSAANKDGIVSHIAEPKPEYYGHYKLSFNDSTIRKASGWTVGFGTIAEYSYPRSALATVDFLLAPLGTTADNYEVSESHANFFFDKDAVLTLRSAIGHERNTILAGAWIRRGRRRSITTRRSIVAFGNLTYSLEYLDMDEREYQKSLQAYLLERQLHHILPPSALSATPSNSDYLLHGTWNIRATVGKGAFGLVNAAKNV